MKVSIIVPVYNAETQIKQALDSVLNQTYQNYELILINDGSTDESLKVCQAYAEKNEKIVLQSINNSGPGVARNIGLNQVTGEYIAFLDADDSLAPDFLEKMVELAIQGDYDIVSSNHYRVDTEITESKNTYQTGTINQHGTEGEKDRYDLFKTSSSFGYVWGKLYNTTFVEGNNLRFSKERQVFLEDILFNLKAIAYTPNYYVLNEPLYYYNVYEDSLSNKKEEITERVITLLENYVQFLDTENKYEENLDLFVPLTTRVIAWSLFKSMENEPAYKNILSKVQCFTQNKTIQRVLNNQESFKELRQLNSSLQTLLYSFITLSLRYNMERILALVFYVLYPLFRIYINQTVKA